MMDSKEIDELERKYKGYLPMQSAKQILNLINYTRELERKLKEKELEKR